MLGDSGYGKSSIVFRLLKDEFLKKKEPTIGLDFATKTLAMTNGKKVKFNIWDTAGQNHLHLLLKLIIKNIAFIIVMDVTDEKKNEQAEKWYKRYDREKRSRFCCKTDICI